MADKSRSLMGLMKVVQRLPRPSDSREVAVKPRDGFDARKPSPPSSVVAMARMSSDRSGDRRAKAAWQPPRVLDKGIDLIAKGRAKSIVCELERIDERIENRRGGA